MQALEIAPSVGPAWAEGLNPSQRLAVDHRDGPLLIAAGAGTGKTRTLVSRLARLLDEGVAPERILLVTFSRRAAAELARRAGQLTDPLLARRVVAGTFHSVAHNLLRRYGAALGLADGFSVLGQGDAKDLLALVRAPVAADSRTRFPRTDTVASIYGRVVSSQMPLEETVVRWFPFCADDVEGLRSIFSTYTKRKRDQRLLDLEDLLLYWRAAVTDRSLGPALAERFDHILVDEYQDTNLVQADILRAMAVHDIAITVVGDDAQAIYSFRGATVRNILDFPLHFPGTSTVTLEQNYRSTTPILELANTVIAGVGEGVPKHLWTDRVRRRPSHPGHLPGASRPRPWPSARPSSTITSRASRCATRRSCSGRATTATCSRWSSAGDASPSSSTAASASSRQPTSATSWPCSASSRTRGTSWPGCASSTWPTAPVRRRSRRSSATWACAIPDGRVRIHSPCSVLLRRAPVRHRARRRTSPLWRRRSDRAGTTSSRRAPRWT